MGMQAFIFTTCGGSEYLVAVRRRGQLIEVPVLAEVRGRREKVEDGITGSLPSVGRPFAVGYDNALGEFRRLQTSVVTGVREL